jgi:hypothetical protein
MSWKAILVDKEDHSWIHDKKSDMEVSRYSKVVNMLLRFYEKHKGVDPDFKYLQGLHNEEHIQDERGILVLFTYCMFCGLCDKFKEEENRK